MKTTFSLLTALLVVLLWQPTIDAQAQDHQTGFSAQVNIAEWDVPWERTRPRDPMVAPDGTVWFCGQAGGYIASLNPETGEMKKYDLGEGAGPHNLIVAPDGMVWYAGNRRAHIGMLNPETGDITKYDMPDPAARDPHTLVWLPDGNIAFTVQGGNMVGHLDVTSGEVKLAAAENRGSRPYGIKVAPDGEVWVVLFGTNRLAHFDMVNVELHEFELPREEARPRRMEITSDGRIWYGDYAGGYMGVFDPETAEFTEWQMPSAGNARVYGMAKDDKDVIWFVETGVSPNRFVGFDTRSESFTRAADVPSGGGTIRHMYFDDNTGFIWFGADTNTVGRAIVSDRDGS
jgi:virginiamycin B lyase